MKLKKGIIRKFATIMAVLNLLNVGSVICNAENDISVKQELSKEIISTENKEKSYTTYLSKYSESDYSLDSIYFDLNDIVLEKEPINFDVKVEYSGLYRIGMSYKALETKMSTVKIGLKIDGEYPYSNMEELDFPRMWMDEDSVVRTDDLGNEFASQQVLYNNYFYNEALDDAVECYENFMVYLTQGNHKVTIVPIKDKIQIEYFKFSAAASPDKYSSPSDSEQYYKGDTVILEGEDASVKSSNYLVDKSDNSSIQVTPQSTHKNIINYIGGGNWKNVGDTLVWTTPELEAGYYQLGFSYRQNSNIGGKSYRLLMIDGEVPFLEAEKIGFSYSADWEKGFFESDEGKPYLIYFDKGKHEIALTVTAAEMAEVRTLLTDAIAMLGDLYIDITKITGENVDVYRDYDLFTQISDMEERLKTIRSSLMKSGEILLELTGEKSGSKYSVIMNMVQTIKQMLDNKYESHRYKDTYYSNYCSVSSVLQELREMPLDIDKITLTSVGAEEPFECSNPFEQFWFSVKRFIVSFSKDYNTVSSSELASFDNLVN